MRILGDFCYAHGAAAQQPCDSLSNPTLPRAAARGGRLLSSERRRRSTSRSRDFFASRQACYAVIVLLAALLASGGVAVAAPRKGSPPRKGSAPSYRCSANPAVASATPKYANRFFRLISTLFDASTGNVITEILTNGRNWVEDPRLEPVLALRSEGKCKASWAITAVSAVEMAYALVASSTPSMDPPQRLSVQQVLECRNSTSSSCAAGGWPTAALDFMVDATMTWGGLACEAGYAYTQKDGKCNRNKAKQQATAIGITGYDQVDYYGWLGLMLAVYAQPTIAFVRGSYPSFQTYTDGLYYDQGCAAAGVVDHSVVVMGYSISAVEGAYWILRNSWGAGWGMQGYMKMSFEGGVGICGIHSVPALYPIIQTPLPCQSPQNPCGGGQCEAGMGSYYGCVCLDPIFIPVADKGGAQTCAYADVCSQQDENPCAVGTCINDNAGGFFCLCPPGFDQGYRPNGAHTCVPSTPPYTYTVVFPIDIDCPLVYQLYGLTEEAFLAQNLQLGVDHCETIPANTAVTVAPPLMGAVHCVLYYSWTATDTCQSVADNFWLTVDDLVTLNPGINCTDCTAWNAPTVNQQLCVAKGSGGGDVPKLPMCTSWYTVQSGDTCQSIMADFSLNQTAFFSLNPGVGCDSLFASVGGSTFGWSGGGVQVCRQLAVSKRRCLAFYSVTRGDFCARIISLKFQNSARKLAELNNGYVCTNDRLYVGLSLCTRR
ncbi:unnamed protein product [Closterium sp. NIES-64]|nr:unnamed protein product [Closterium sp. NIES-64]